MEIPNAPNSVDARRAQRRQKWYAIAEPIRGVYDSYDKCQQDLKGIAGSRRGHVQVVDALRRLRNMLAEMVGLYKALNELIVREDVTSGSQITIVHDYYGVSAWMQAGTPPGATMAIDPGYYKAPFKAHPWGPPKDPVIGAVVSACWESADRKQLNMVFRHQPGHRSEEAGTHHFVRFN